MSELTDREFALLNGLRLALRPYLCASEYNEAQSLHRRGLVEIWDNDGGFPYWRITNAGIMALDPPQPDPEAR
jgi:hypothetical protein